MHAHVPSNLVRVDHAVRVLTEALHTQQPQVRAQRQSFTEFVAQCQRACPFNRSLAANGYTAYRAEIAPKTVISARDITDRCAEIKEMYAAIMTDPSLWVNQEAPARNDSLFTSSEQLYDWPEHAAAYRTKPAERVYYIKPFAQQIRVFPDDIVCIHGDLHGDIHSFLSFLSYLKKQGYLQDDWTITPSLRKSTLLPDGKGQKCYILLLGDYVDRGTYGVEVWDTILRLKLANPYNVFMVRGNHEDVAISSAIHANAGFYKECIERFPSKDSGDEVYRQLTKIQDLFPVVLYLSSYGDDGVLQVVQCCHGGIEPRYNPENLLYNVSTAVFDWYRPRSWDETYKKKALSKAVIFGVDSGDALREEYRNTYLPYGARVSWDEVQTWMSYPGPQAAEHMTPYGNIGFLWNDFAHRSDTTKPEDELYTTYTPGRGLRWAEQPTGRALGAIGDKSIDVFAVLRAHQHGSELAPDFRQGNNPVRLWRYPERVEDAPYLQDSFNLVQDSVLTFCVGTDSWYAAYLERGMSEQLQNTFGILTVGREIAPYNKPQVREKYWRMSVVRQKPFVLAAGPVGQY